jgi:uncharacterized protein YuzE
MIPQWSAGSREPRSSAGVCFGSQSGRRSPRYVLSASTSTVELADVMRANTYDPDADAAYIYVGEAPIVESEEIAPNIVVDYDEHERVVGIEILFASRTLAPGSWKDWPLPGADLDPHAHAAE